jgi:hypothetical protein
MQSCTDDSSTLYICMVLCIRFTSSQNSCFLRWLIAVVSYALFFFCEKVSYTSSIAIKTFVLIIYYLVYYILYRFARLQCLKTKAGLFVSILYAIGTTH